MISVHGCRQCLHISNLLQHWTGYASASLFDSILNTEFEGIHTQLFANLIYDGLGPKRGAWDSRGTVGSRFGSVDHHVIPFNTSIGNLIWSKYTLAGLIDWRSGECTSLIDHRNVRSGDNTFFVSANLNADRTTRGGAGSFEYFSPAHLNLHRASGFL